MMRTWDTLRIRKEWPVCTAKMGKYKGNKNGKCEENLEMKRERVTKEKVRTKAKERVGMVTRDLQKLRTIVLDMRDFTRSDGRWFWEN